ncbi:MAG: hypothetical protein FJZ56_00215 [Chlamydiae bacterium]|nr:hypothetical protein [Chlamydiota bacterium]
MKVLTYNILAPCYASLHAHHYPSWDERKHIIIDQIHSVNPDIVCLQEVDYKSFMFIESELRAKGLRGIYAMKSFGKLEGVALFFRFEELLFVGSEIVLYHDYYLDKSTSIPFASGDNVLFLYVKTIKGLLGVATTHIHAYFPEDNYIEKKVNCYQTQQLFTSFLPERTYIDHWIIAGDFNTEKIKDSYLIDNDLVDAHKDVFLSTFEDKKIDYILHSNTLESSPILLDKTEGSDHRPLLTDFCFKATI